MNTEFWIKAEKGQRCTFYGTNPRPCFKQAVEVMPRLYGWYSGRCREHTVGPRTEGKR
jgi:hypothetical protein